VQKPRADASMVVHTSKKDIDVPIADHRRFLKKAFQVYGKTIIVIHKDLVNQLQIEDQTWLEEEITKEGILLRISSWRDRIWSQE